MQADTSSLRPCASAPARAAARPGRRVTDAPTRMFHWLFALSFLGAYVSADGERWRALHVTLGYTMAGLLAFRVLYGLFGPRQARLGLMWRRLGGLPEWLRTAARARSASAVNWRQGQNLLMALAVVALLVALVPLALSGYAAFNGWGDAFGDEWLGDLHGFVGDAFLAIVLTHLAAIAGLSVLRRRNQAWPMLSGRVEGTGPDMVTHDRTWLAGVLLVAVLAFAAWQWQQAPNGLMPAADTGALHGGRGHHDDDD